MPFVHYGLLTEGSRLNLNSYEDTYYVTFMVAGTLVDGRKGLADTLYAVEPTVYCGEGEPCRSGVRQLVEESARLATGPPIAPTSERQQDLLQDPRFALRSHQVHA